MNETTTQTLEWTFSIGQWVNLIVGIFILSLPFFIVNWFSKKEKQRKEQLDRIEEKLDQLGQQ